MSAEYTNITERDRKNALRANIDYSRKDSVYMHTKRRNAHMVKPYKDYTDLDTLRNTHTNPNLYSQIQFSCTAQTSTYKTQFSALANL